MRVFFFGGKGGVGKTTASSAFAVKLSEQGKKVLLLSTDPAHSLSDVFNTELQGETKLSENLTVKEIDLNEELKEYRSRVFKLAEATLRKETLRELEGIIHSLEESPGIEDVVIFEALSKEVVYRENEYDYIVVDTAPTGHTLGLLKTVRNLGNFLEEIVKLKEKVYELKKLSGKSVHEEALEYLKERKERFKKFSEIIYDKSYFFAVLTPEKLPFEETKRLVNSLKHYGIRVKALIINKVLPENPQDEFLKARKEVEKKFLKEIENYFMDIEKISIPYQKEEVVGYEKLKEFSKFLPLG
ncbi:TRC40/GET3/ArsA family transport-energizing ATPase [Aquifex aeolicus]|uniref:Putative arsenical pump-driving ATPase 2 n=1 Tax=Aquifex aeolicus (strain VF5) TaxID=224324 RepID=ARSA2_AQUAE|nr:TRC40/GET3/ArsA family transport-energizing ATPase [Aquifex aeolicus]O66674.1 RecName: Full=Putative arsenical pump-driving ATPase 2; AltName: Full=Arsenical resistance ATPase 2; AltName: Full=Arsenite-translocating ATPase 2; AltName: Full=Arsenite-transporting ATPase 2 [Aquifex aeolicus VF5]AAC06625.1 anion transporting ATPase [Aquifex aeolicus VF5]